jgi:hypothetical protein
MAMQKLVEHKIKVDEKITHGVKLPETMFLYAVDTQRLVLTTRPNKTLEEKAIVKEKVKVFDEKSKYVIVIPAKIYNFYRLEESDYTVMVSEKEPTTIIIAF